MTVLRLLTALSFAAAFGSAAHADPASAEAPSFYVMRHLENNDGVGHAARLSGEGAANAQLLAHWFTRHPPAAIYVSTTQLALDTAAPLAIELGIYPKLYDPKDSAALIEAVKEEARPVLIVGHRDTVPDIIERLGGEPPAPLQEGAFGDIWAIGATDQTVTRHRLKD